MLPASERLRKTSVFQRAYSARNSVSSGCVILYVLPRRPPQGKAAKLAKAAGSNQTNNQSSQARWPLTGFAISKKVLKSACKRNRAKRRVREAYRLIKNSANQAFYQETFLHRWYALVYVINPTAITASFGDISVSVKDCLLKAGKKFGHRP